jgi:hypothetical protein
MEGWDMSRSTWLSQPTDLLHCSAKSTNVTFRAFRNARKSAPSDAEEYGNVSGIVSGDEI